MKDCITFDKKNLSYCYDYPILDIEDILIFERYKYDSTGELLMVYDVREKEHEHNDSEEIDPIP